MESITVGKVYQNRQNGPRREVLAIVDNERIAFAERNGVGEKLEVVCITEFQEWARRECEFKPCPFCYGDGVMDKMLRDGYEGERDDPDAWAYYVRCLSCACQGGWAKSTAAAKARWNWRVKG